MSEAKATASTANPASSGSSPAAAEATTTDPDLLPPSHWQPIEDDADSAHGDDAPYSTASLTSSVLRYRNINGRTFHSEIGSAQYWGANDDRQMEAGDMTHHVLTLLCDGSIYLAPIKDPKKALDIGTGTGIWAVDFADKFEACEVIGTDVSPIQPTWIPPNLAFHVEDCTQTWTFPPDDFDYVHIRYLFGSIQDWVAFFKEAYQVLKPGGWLESLEASPTIHAEDSTPLPSNSAIVQWGPLFISGGKIINRVFTVIEDDIQEKAMLEAGFVNIQVKDFKVPMGSWPTDEKEKEMGIFCSAIMQDAEGFVLFMTTVAGWSNEQVQIYLAHFRKEFKSRKYHTYVKVRVVWGQKPEV